MYLDIIYSLFIEIQFFRLQCFRDCNGDRSERAGRRRFQIRHISYHVSGEELNCFSKQKDACFLVFNFFLLEEDSSWYDWQLFPVSIDYCQEYDAKLHELVTCNEMFVYNSCHYSSLFMVLFPLVGICVLETVVT